MGFTISSQNLKLRPPAAAIGTIHRKARKRPVATRVGPKEMARIKPQAAPRKFEPTRAAPAPGWAWLIAGIVLGLLSALMINTAVKRNAADFSIQGEANQAPKSTTPIRGPSIPPLPPIEMEQGFGFYKELREQDALIPPKDPVRPDPLPVQSTVKKIPPPSIDSQISSRPAVERSISSNTSRSGVPSPEEYLLLAGSFRSSQRAIDLKSRLVAMGLRATVRRGVSSANDTMHRVQIGPLEHAEANQVQQRLRQNRIDSILLRAND